ncbi:hypothetical protein DMN91_009556 [Ooceraea biroi]|uniref:Odorant receptor n=1 Tax=Ooceraea biroi TaxID=2015173 RepID=A0A026VXR8_OOCBI|nr:uncharacterized protein LOC105285734 isoform X2 [Ooceraea biroi]EZA48256.1 hypothetical protein X777_14156 [Ooceraea biroi]RLU17323.1 hypothetical protein DMN91_009556 [Ooceraea biroi]
MHGIEEHYYKIIRIFLKTLGIWPYQQSYLTLVQRVLFTSILSTFIIVQLLAFFTMRFSTGLLLRILSLVFPTLLVIIKYCTFVIQADKVKQLIGQVGDDLNLLQDKSEIDIIKKYADSINFITIYGIVFCHFGILCYLTLQFLPLILDVIVPLNTSRSLKLMAITEYFVNREKYASAMLLHEILTVYTGVMTLCSTGLTIMTYILHACALLKIASHRMKHAIQEDVLAMSNPVKEYLLYQKIVDIVFIHRRVMQFISFSVSSFVVSFALLLIFGVISLSLNLFRLLQLMTVTYDIGEISVIFLLVTLHINYMFAVNYGGEILQNHGMELFEATYNGLWYAAPLRTQKLLLFIMQKTTVKVTLICGGIFVASLEGFVTLVNAAVSYFTVIYSTR